MQKEENLAVTAEQIEVWFDLAKVNRRITSAELEQELADALGVTVRTVSNYRSGKTSVRPEQVEALREALRYEPLQIEMP
ncbi:MAG: helix-turn-helix transcriptional regulator [Saprospiraceae bacterium]|nr:helix-turn-helix transcriptional regulator [Saprospiraceae bacterium]